KEQCSSGNACLRGITMARAVLLILLGVAAGFGAAALLVREGAPPGSAPAVYSANEASAQPVVESAASVSVSALFDAKAAALASAEALDDAFDIERAIEAAA